MRGLFLLLATALAAPAFPARAAQPAAAEPAAQPAVPEPAAQPAAPEPAAQPAAPEPAAQPGVPAPAAPPEPRREPQTRSALEVDLRLGYGFMVQPKVNHTGETFSRNGGPAVALGAVYRSSYFLSPALDVAFQPLYRSAGVVDLGTLGGPTKTTGSLRTLAVTVGAVVDLWKFRLGAGIGEYKMLVRSSMRGQTLSTSEWDMGYAFSAGAFLWDSPRLRLGLESRVGIITDGGTSFFSIGAIAAGDALRW